MSSKSRKRKLQILRLFAVGTIFLMVMSGMALKQYYEANLEPVSAQEDLVEFHIANGSTLRAVIQNLENEGIIKSALIANLYVRSNEVQIKAGDYIVDRAWDVPQLLAHLSGNNAIVDQVKVTIPEGTWAKDIAAKIAEATNVSAQELLDLWSDRVFLDEMIAKYSFLSEDIYRKELRIPLEGFLYPETYYFYANTSPRAVTIKMLDQTASVLKGYEKEIEASQYSIFELVSLASLVQFEANNLVDMKLVAGIFYERMRIDMPLQASATVCYALYEKYKTWQDCEYNIHIESPYNTYYVKKLPIGPISNPGPEAYEAVFHPTESEYLFFVSDVKGDRKNHYAKTYAEHLKNVAKYLD